MILNNEIELARTHYNFFCRKERACSCINMNLHVHIFLYRKIGFEVQCSNSNVEPINPFVDDLNIYLRVRIIIHN